MPLGSTEYLSHHVRAIISPNMALLSMADMTARQVSFFPLRSSCASPAQLDKANVAPKTVGGS